MCGIIGYAGRDAAAMADRVARAREMMANRGPDDAGSWHDEHACLGSRRLAVFDLSPAGHMPMTSADGKHVIVFNGAIYNFVELRAKLAPHLPFRSSGDTEVILNGFKVWGWTGLLERLDGMFAFAIWDVNARKLFAARDRLGEKPFFHARVGDGFAFASTLTALMTLRGGVGRVNPHALDAYLTYQAVPAPFSIFDDCSQLEPAHELRFDAVRAELRSTRYWDVAYSPKRRVSEREAIETIDSLTHESIRQRLRSDVPTGTLLSGGVDSSLITAIASKEHGAPIDAVTMGHDGPEDERPFARLVASRYGVRLHEEVLAPTVVQDLPAIVWQYGQPLADVSIIPNYYLAAAARRVMTVALVGDGADEAFGGYSRPVIERAASTYRRYLPWSVRKTLGTLLTESPGRRAANPLLHQLALLAQEGMVASRSGFVYDRAFRSMRDTAYTEGFSYAVSDWHPDELYAAAWDRAVAADDVDRALYGDLTTYLPDQLLAKADVSAMAFGLETRSPFLSRAIVEYSATLPTELRLKRYRTKYLLKRVAERYVPHEAIYRRKRGFVIPASRWLREDLAPYARAALDTPRFLDRGWLRPDAVRTLLRQHADGSHDWGQQIWTLLVLAVWAQLSLDGTLSPNDPLDALLAGATR
jgi:asparagine synthase (glutamine-hydrolysing)